MQTKYVREETNIAKHARPEKRATRVGRAGQRGRLYVHATHREKVAREGIDNHSDSRETETKQKQREYD